MVVITGCYLFSEYAKVTRDVDYSGSVVESYIQYFLKAAKCLT